MDDYDDIARKFAESIPAEYRLAGLAPEQRLAGLAPEQRLAGLSTEQQWLALSDEALRALPLTIATRGDVTTEVLGPGDTSLAIRYTADRLLLRIARVEYPGDAAEWKEDFERLRKGRSMLWVIHKGYFELVGGDVR